MVVFEHRCSTTVSLAFLGWDVFIATDREVDVISPGRAS